MTDCNNGAFVMDRYDEMTQAIFCYEKALKSQSLKRVTLVFFGD